MMEHIHEATVGKREEWYIFRFRTSETQAMLRVVGRYASDPNREFNWYDAAAICRQIRAIEARREAAAARTRHG